MTEADRESSEDLDAAWDEPEPVSSGPSVHAVEVPEELDAGWDEEPESGAPAKVQRHRPRRPRREPAKFVPKAAAPEPVPVGLSKKERREQERRNRVHAS